LGEPFVKNAILLLTINAPAALRHQRSSRVWATLKFLGLETRLTLRVSPMAAGVTDRLSEVSDLVALLESEERELERAA